jgi:energy-converting hydrogenase B subunit D
VMILVVSILVISMLVAAIAACVLKDLLSAVISSCMVSLIAAILFYLLQAPDVAMAEAAIGAALVTTVFVIAIIRTKRHEE